MEKGTGLRERPRGLRGSINQSFSGIYIVAAKKPELTDLQNNLKSMGFLDRACLFFHRFFLGLPITGDILKAAARKDLPPSQRTRQALEGITGTIVAIIAKVANFCNQQLATAQSVVSKDLWQGIKGYFGPITSMLAQIFYLPINPAAWCVHSILNILTGGWTNKPGADHFRKVTVQNLIWILVAIPGFAERGLRILTWKIFDNLMATGPSEPVVGLGVAGVKKVAQVFGAGSSNQQVKN